MTRAKHDSRLVKSLAVKLGKLKPKTLTTQGQIFKTLPSEDHFAVMAKQIIYGRKRRIHTPYHGTIIAFSGFMERYGRKPKIGEINLRSLRSLRWLEDKNPYTVSECVWYGCSPKDDRPGT